MKLHLLVADSRGFQDVFPLYTKSIQWTEVSSMDSSTNRKWGRQCWLCNWTIYIVLLKLWVYAKPIETCEQHFKKKKRMENVRSVFICTAVLFHAPRVCVCVC